MHRRSIIPTTPALSAYAAGRTIAPIGFLPNGRPVFPIAGGAENLGEDGEGGDGKGKKAEYTPPATQEDLNRIIGERLSREREKYSDYEDLKAKAEKHDLALQAAMTEQEKAVAAARAEGATEAASKVNSRLVSAEARALAAEAKFRNPSIAVATLGDLSAIKVAEDGTVDSAAIKVKLAELAASDPYLVDDGAPAKKAPPKPDGSQGGGGGEDKPSVNRGREMFENRRGAKKAAAS